MIRFKHDEKTTHPGPPRRDDRRGRRPGLCARPRNSPSKSRGPPEEKIGQAIYDTYRPQSVEEIQTALKKIFAPIFEDIYGFSISHEQISHITDCILDEVYEG